MDTRALRLLSRRESRKDHWPRLILNVITTLSCANLHSSNAARPLKMLVFDRTRPSLYSGISAAQSTYTALLWQCCICSIDPCLLSTSDEYSRLLCFLFFPISIWCNQMTEPRSQLPPPMTSTTTPRVVTTTSLPTVRSRIGGSQAGGLRLFDRSVLLCPAFLKAYLSLFYICTQISDASADVCKRAYVFEPSRPLACNIKLVLF
jgi:hypothetical protein